MEFRNFLEMVEEHLKDFLPEQYRNAEVTICEMITNNDCRMAGVRIAPEGSNITGTIRLNPYFKDMENGASPKEVLAEIADYFQDHYMTPIQDIKKFLDYDYVKDKVICKLINEEANRDYLKDIPYTKVEDLAVVYQILLGKRNSEIMIVTMTNDLLERLGVSLEDLHEQALKNLEVLQPHSFRGLNEISIDIMARNIVEMTHVSMDEAREMAEGMMPYETEKAYVLSNDTGVDGAAAILNDTIREEIADKLGDFYVIPMSVNETMIVPKDVGLDMKEMEQTVKIINSTKVPEHEVLSDHIYEYDAKEHELFRVDKSQERRKTQKREESDRISLKDRLNEKKNESTKQSMKNGVPVAAKKKETTL